MIVFFRCGSLSELIAKNSPYTSHFTRFWDIYSAQIRIADFDLTSLLSLRTLQKLLIVAFQNYHFAKSAWSLIVVPNWFGIPRVGSIVARNSNYQYIPMSSPVTGGTSVFVDIKVSIISLKGSISKHILSGICTAACDKHISGSKCLEFSVNGPCTVWIAWDTRCRRYNIRTSKYEYPKWLLRAGFIRTNDKIVTSASTHIVFRRDYEAIESTIVLGGCANRDIAGHNYFILISSLDSRRKYSARSSPTLYRASIASASEEELTNAVGWDSQQLLPCWYLQPYTLMNDIVGINTPENMTQLANSKNMKTINYNDPLSFNNSKAEGKSSLCIYKTRDAIHLNVEMNVLQFSFEENRTKLLVGFLSDVNVISIASSDSGFSVYSRFLRISSDVSFTSSLQCRNEYLFHPCNFSVSFEKTQGEYPLQLVCSPIGGIYIDISPNTVQSVLALIDTVKSCLVSPVLNQSWNEEPSGELCSLTNDMNCIDETNNSCTEIIIENCLGEEVVLGIRGAVSVAETRESNLHDNKTDDEKYDYEFSESFSNDESESDGMLKVVPPGTRVAFSASSNILCSHSYSFESPVNISLTARGWQPVHDIAITRDGVTLYSLKSLNSNSCYLSESNKESERFLHSDYHSEVTTETLTQEQDNDFSMRRILSYGSFTQEFLQKSDNLRKINHIEPFALSVRCQLGNRDDIIRHRGDVITAKELDEGNGTWGWTSDNNESDGGNVRNQEDNLCLDDTTIEPHDFLEGNYKSTSNGASSNRSLSNKLVILVTISTNLSLSNQSNGDLLIENQNELIGTNSGNSVKSRQSASVPLNALRTGHIYLKRPEVTFSLSIPKEALDGTKSAQLRRSSEYESMSTILIENTNAEDIMQNSGNSSPHRRYDMGHTTFSDAFHSRSLHRDDGSASGSTWQSYDALQEVTNEIKEPVSYFRYNNKIYEINSYY